MAWLSELMDVVDQPQTLKVVSQAYAQANQNILPQDHTGAIKGGWYGIDTQGALGNVLFVVSIDAC